MPEEIFCMENQHSKGFIGNNVVRFERTNMSDKKPPDDGYYHYLDTFDERNYPLDLTEDEKQEIRVQIAMKRELEGRS